jgi:methylmalonyl-CoA/ethylmalonyl-CoA epimerase
MTGFGLDFHHLGLALRDREQATPFLVGLGYNVGSFIYDPEQNVWLSLCHCPDKPCIELIAPADGQSPIHRMLKREESVMYHTCYAAREPSESVQAMRSAGLVVVEVSPPKPAVLFSGAPVSFYYVDGFGLIELMKL